MFLSPDDQILVMAVKLEKENLDVQGCCLEELKILKTGVEQGDDRDREADGLHV